MFFSLVPADPGIYTRCVDKRVLVAVFSTTTTTTTPVPVTDDDVYDGPVIISMYTS